MGEQKITSTASNQTKIKFLGHLLNDLESLKYMLEHNLIEDDVVRIGAEQEFCLVNEQWRPAKSALDILAEIEDDHFTTELALYNLEINLDPVELKGEAFKKVENQLEQLLAKATQKAQKFNSKILLTGILPSITQHELELEFMTPKDRYFALNDLLTKARGEYFNMRFSGVDEFSLMHNSVMFEACNTSFQMHLQVSPQDFMASYNWAQAIAGPVLACCTNSPLLLGKELWSETRIALFQQSIDTRYVSMAQNDQQSRVSFGNDWLKGDILDYYKSEISYFKTMLSKEIEESSLDELKAGRVPKLHALNVHNGTIYRWNRPCYGVGNGKPHIRIENRYIASGPTVKDEMANFAFWVGLMKGRPAAYDTLSDKFQFADAKSNFIRAARTGSESIMNWMGHKLPLHDLVLKELLPMARKGLEQMKINPASIDEYLGIIEKRLRTQTASQWAVSNFRALKKKIKNDDAVIALTEAIYNNQQKAGTVSDWPALKNATRFDAMASRVGHVMTTTLVTAFDNDLALLTLKYMKWNNIHHLPIVDHHQKLVGLITWRHLQGYWKEVQDEKKPLVAGDIMVKEVFTAHPSDPIKESISLMKQYEIGCLPVVQHEQLVGIVTIKDLKHLEHG